MRIPCPYCGPRDSEEFASLGTVDGARPSPDAGADVWHDYVHLRTNTAGEVREHWQHVFGCRRWLVVTRDTRTHAIVATALAADVGTAP